ncbi:MAG: chitinase [Myxococcaceae bacterium]|nr:chitinase [Myxococcaceae bacterium]
MIDRNWLMSASRRSFALGALIVVGCGQAAEESAGDDSEHTIAAVESALSATAASDQAQQWVDGWYAPDAGQRGPNVYAHESSGTPLELYWKGDSNSPNPAQYRNVSDCSYFVNATLKRAYQLTDASLNSWLCTATDPCGVGRPQAKHYFDAIMNGSRFTTLAKVSQVQRGDLIAMRYASGTDTGHVMWAASAPVAAGTGTDRNNVTIYFYKVDVIDSSASYHGSDDKRHLAGIDQGVGRGTARLVAYADGDLAGYSWSPFNQEVYINGDGQGRSVVAGRYVGTQAAPSAFASVVTPEQFERFFPASARSPAYTYQSLVDAIGSRPEFASFAATGDATTQRREAAALLANVAHETSRLSVLEERTSAAYCSSSACACSSAAGYRGRGPLQLSWNYNYCAAGSFLGLDLQNSPAQVATSGRVGWQTALWFWQLQTGASSNSGAPLTSHAAMTGAKGGFLATVRAINGDLECSQPAGSVGAQERQSRITLYREFEGVLGVPQESLDNSYCP